MPRRGGIRCVRNGASVLPGTRSGYVTRRVRRLRALRYAGRWRVTVMHAHTQARARYGASGIGRFRAGASRVALNSVTA